ncbi:MAG: type II CAAX endopeptidase family protein [Gemmatimonadota bacterium]
MSVDAIAIGVAALLLVVLPLLTARGGLTDDQLDDVRDARTSVYLSAALSLLFFSGLTFLAATWRDVPPEVTGWTVGPPTAAFAWAAVTAAAGLVVIWLVVRVGSRLGLTESDVSFALMPRNGREIGGFLLLAAIAAVGEEYLFRGYSQGVLAEAFGSPWPAVVVTSLSFGISHGYQKLIGIVRATLLGFLLAIPVVRTGSLFPAIAAHFWINAAIGIGGWKFLYPGGMLRSGGADTTN